MRIPDFNIIVTATGVLLLAIVALRVSSGLASQQRAGSSDSARSSEDGPRYSRSGHDLTRPSKDDVARLAEGLTPLERDVLLEEGTERAFTGPLVTNKEAGVYTCRLCGLPLFSSDAKFESGTGWPSFFQPVDPDHVHEETDRRLGVTRTEIECGRCRSHLGHVFKDGPRPTGLRYCMNSAALKFFGRDQALPDASRPASTQVAYFAGGCFWGIEDRFEQVPGVLDAVSGYQGGTVARPTYKQVCSGRTGHAESVRVTFDPSRVSYEQLLAWFFAFHDPTQLNRQGPDVGTQYRSAIFAADDAQLEQARAYVAALQQTPAYAGRQIVTRIEPAGPFYEAEAYHQDYHARHGGSCALPAAPNRPGP